MKEIDSKATIIPGNILTMTKSELSYALCCFVLEVINEMSEEYSRETLYSLLLSLQMYFHSKAVYHKFMQDPDFTDVHNILDN